MVVHAWWWSISGESGSKKAEWWWSMHGVGPYVVKAVARRLNGGGPCMVVVHMW